MGLEIDETEFRRIIGMNEQSCRDSLQHAIGDFVDVSELIRQTDAIYQQKIAQGVPLKKGARACIEWLTNERVPQCIATSSKQAIAQQKLKHHDLLVHFHTIASGDQVTHSKPNPEIFITAANRMGAAPSDCLIFEDSRHGVIAAQASGGSVILVPDLAIHDDESLNLADEIWDSLEQGPRRFAEWQSNPTT